ncbi:MAG: hypothetical protein AAF550_10095 [Myxococcota bacterium]
MDSRDRLYGEVIWRGKKSVTRLYTIDLSTTRDEARATFRVEALPGVDGGTGIEDSELVEFAVEETKRHSAN